jgi:hypothetical protein
MEIDSSGVSIPNDVHSLSEIDSSMFSCLIMNDSWSTSELSKFFVVSENESLVSLNNDDSGVLGKNPGKDVVFICGVFPYWYSLVNFTAVTEPGVFGQNPGNEFVGI